MNRIFSSLLSVVIFLFVQNTLLYAIAPNVTITKNFKNVPLRTVFETIEQETGYKIKYNAKQLNDNKLVTRDFKETAPLTVLRSVIGKRYTLTKEDNEISIKLISTKNSTQSLKQDTPTKPNTPSSTTITKKFTQTPLLTVFRFVEKKTNYNIKYNAKQLDTTKLITKQFKNATAENIIQTAVGNLYTVSQKKNNITIKLNKEKTLTTKSDTTDNTISKKEDSLSFPKHYLQVFCGLGYGTMNLSLRNNPQTGSNPGKTNGNVGVIAQIQYAYYFHRNWGITMGLGFDNYCSATTLNTAKQWNNQLDSENDNYNHITKTNNWKEKEQLYIFDIPVGIQMKYPICAKGTAIYAGTGIKMSMPISKKYNLQSGSISHEGYYPNTHVTLYDLPDRDAYTEHIGKDFTTQKYNIDIKPVNIAFMADFGFMFPVSHEIDIMLGAYFQYICNDMKRSSTDMGWQQPNAIIEYRKHSFMNQYPGIANSEFTKSIHPYQVGIKIGINWHKEKSKTNIENNTIIEEKGPTPLIVDSEKTIAEREKIQEVEPQDTEQSAVKKQPTVSKTKRTRLISQTATQKQLEKFTSSVIIWFDLGSAVPRLQPENTIDSIATLLKNTPTQKILINGHCSKDGNEEYNRKLSEERAKAVYDMLIQAGVNPDQMQWQGLGVNIEYKDTQKGKEQHNVTLDRRVEIIPLK